MLKVDDCLIIRQASRTMSIRAIARTCCCSRKVIRKAQRKPEPQPYRLTVPRTCPVLGPYHAAIARILDDDIHAPPKQPHTMMQVYRRLVGPEARHRTIRGEAYQWGGCGAF